MLLDDLTRDVALMAGESLTLLCESTETGLPSFSERVQLCLGSAFREIILTIPKEELTGWKSLKGLPMEIDDEGCAVIALPPDFVMLHSVRMSDWNRPVAEILPANHYLYGVQGRRLKGLRGTPERPLGFFGIKDGSRSLELYSCRTSTASIAEGWYMPMPEVKADGTVEIPERLYEKLVERLGREIRN